MTPEIIDSDSGWPYTKAKTAVLTAAASVISEEGTRAATLKNIATRAGITEPAIFRHFEGVDGLFNGLFSAFERMYSRFEAAYGSGQQGLPRLREAMSGMAMAVAASRDFAYILLHAEQVFRGYPDLRKKVVELKKKDERLALECIEEGISSGDIRSDVEPASIAASAIGTFYLVCLAWIESGYAFDLCEESAARWDDIERLISAKPLPRSAERPARARSAALRVDLPVSRESVKAVKRPAAKASSKAAPKAAKAKAPAAKAKPAKASQPKKK